MRLKQVGFYPNTSKPQAMAVANELVAFVETMGLECFVAHSAKQLAIADFVVVLGGDGTMLSAARETAMHGTPLLGINMGKLGYLTDVEVDGAKDAILAVINGKYTTEKRMMLQAVIDENDTQLIALNDVYITHNRLLGFEIWVNDEYIDSLNADGIIVCTPTGSTAYNLSAGGPILKPDAEIIAVTPICPHALHARPLVLSSKDEIVIKISCDSGQPLHNIVSADGETHETHNCEKITIKRSQYSATIIKTGERSFFDVLRKKLISRM